MVAGCPPHQPFLVCPPPPPHTHTCVPSPPPYTQAGFAASGHPSVRPELDLVEDEDQITHEMSLEDKHDPQVGRGTGRGGRTGGATAHPHPALAWRRRERGQGAYPHMCG